MHLYFIHPTKRSNTVTSGIVVLMGYYKLETENSDLSPFCLWDVFTSVCCYCHATYAKVPG